MTCDTWDVVSVPFPFTDSSQTKRRPALVLSSRPFNETGHVILAMITSAMQPAWPTDTHIRELQAAGLRRPCCVRLKLFTLDTRLLVATLGRLAEPERAGVTRALMSTLSLTPQTAK
jgi:mRNA interferase MazF